VEGGVIVTQFGYAPDRAERAKVQLDRDLKQVEYLTERIARTIPQAGSIPERLDEAKEIVGEVVSDPQDLIDERTEVPA
jgi:hypothetical protein